GHQIGEFFLGEFLTSLQQLLEGLEARIKLEAQGVQQPPQSCEAAVIAHRRHCLSSEQLSIHLCLCRSRSVLNAAAGFAALWQSKSAASAPPQTNRRLSVGLQSLAT